MASVTGTADGSLYFVEANRVMHVTPAGALETVAGTGNLGFTPAVPSSDARTVAIWPTGSSALAVDAPRHRLFYAQRCAIYVVDLQSHAMDLYMGNPNSCGKTGDGGLAVDALSNTVGYMAVTETGVLFFVTVGASGPVRALRYIDTGGRIDTIFDAGVNFGSPALSIAGYLGDVAAIPGENDEVFMAGDCTTPTGTRECILRVSTAGALTHIAGAIGTDGSPEGIAATSAVLGDGAWIEALSTGEIVVGESVYDRIRVIGVNGNIQTIAGTYNMPGDTGDGGPSSAALVRDPSWVSVYGADHIVFWQQGDRAIRSIW